MLQVSNSPINSANENEYDQQEEPKPGASWEHQDLASVKIKVFRGHQNRVTSVQFCKSEQAIFTGSFDHTCRLWDVATGEMIAIFSGHHTNISEARLSHDETCFVSCGWDRRIIVTDIETKKPIWEGHHGGIVTGARFNSAGTMIVSGSDLDYRVYLWDCRMQKKIHAIRDLHHTTPTRCMFTPKDDRILTTAMDRTAKLWDIRAQKTTIVLKDHTNVVASAAISKDERKLATASWDKTLKMYDISTGMYRQTGPTTLTDGHDGCVGCCNFSFDGSMLVSGGYDNSVVVWDAENHLKELKVQGHDDWIEDVCFSKDRRHILSASRDSTIRMWNIEHTEELPMVMETKISAGVKVLKCTVCGKPFSYSEMEERSGQPKCVFCRMADPSSRSLSSFSQKVSEISSLPADMET